MPRRAPSPLASDTTRLLIEADGLGVLRRQAPQVVTEGLGPPLRQQQASSSLRYLEDIANTSITQIDTVDKLGEFLCQADLHEVPPAGASFNADSDGPASRPHRSQ